MSRKIGKAFLSAGIAAWVCGPAAAQVNEKTATVVVGGYSSDGWTDTGVFGIDVQDDTVDGIASAVGPPYMGVPGGLDQPNVVTMAEFYGDTPPAYYTAADIAELAAVTALWGGGLPRYALIQAKFIRHVLERTGAEQVNVVGASLGAAISRYMLETDVEGLMSEGASPGG